MKKIIAVWFFTVCGFLGLASSASTAAAQESSGPIVPCVGLPCTGQDVPPWPETGAWYNPSESGSGFMIEIQSSKLLAFYYGYDESGQPTWWQFSDQLEPGSEPGVTWVAEGPPNRFTGGNCFGCDYSPPNEPEQLESVRFEFLQRANMRITLPDGSQQYMVPITYGTSSKAFFPDYPDLLFPTMEPDSYTHWGSRGLWYFVFDQTQTGEENGPWNIDFLPLNIGLPDYLPDGIKGQRDGPLLSYFLVWFDSPVNALGFGHIYCELKDREGETEPGCTYEAGSGNIYDIAVANFTDSRIQGVDKDGRRFEAFRAFAD